MPIIRLIIVKELNHEPVDLLGKATWDIFLNETAVHEKEAARCRASFDALSWESEALASAIDEFRCAECSSSLIRPVDEGNSDLSKMKLACSACGATPEVEDVFEAALDEHFASECHFAVKDGGEPPLEECPECRRNTYVLEENCCANPYCGFSLEERECAVCGTPISIADYDSGPGDLCGYHAYVADRERDR
jgi:hypothetical protein